MSFFACWSPCMIWAGGSIWDSDSGGGGEGSETAADGVCSDGVCSDGLCAGGGSVKLFLAFSTCCSSCKSWVNCLTSKRRTGLSENFMPLNILEKRRESSVFGMGWNSLSGISMTRLISAVSRTTLLNLLFHSLRIMPWQTASFRLKSRGRET